MGSGCLVVVALLVVIMSPTLLSTTYAGEVHCDIVKDKCSEKNCNFRLCGQWYGTYNHKYEKAYCQKTRFNDLCCCEFVVVKSPLPKYPTSSQQPSLVPPFK